MTYITIRVYIEKIVHCKRELSFVRHITLFRTVTYLCAGGDAVLCHKYGGAPQGAVLATAVYLPYHNRNIGQLSHATLAV